jgi:preprotein translocase subunit SecG
MNGYSPSTLGEMTVFVFVLFLLLVCVIGYLWHRVDVLERWIKDHISRGYQKEKE